jgi:hypothetical protein
VPWLKRTLICVVAVAVTFAVVWLLLGRLLLKVWGPYVCGVPEGDTTISGLIGAALLCALVIVGILILVTIIVSVVAAVVAERYLVRPSSMGWTILMTASLLVITAVLFVLVANA